MPYLFWQDGSRLHRERLEGARVLGADPQRATLIAPSGGPPVQALVQPEGSRWRLRALEGAIVRREGTLLPAEGRLLEEGDSLAIGAWEFRFSERFPGLDHDRFWETAGAIPLPAGPAAIAALRWTASLAQRLEQGLLAREDPSILTQRMLEEVRSFLAAETGAYFVQVPGQALHAQHLIGAAIPEDSAARGLIEHAQRDRVNLMSNDPLRDPRLGTAPVKACGPVAAAPVIIEPAGEDEPAGGAFVLVRALGAPPFDSADLSLLRGAADLAALAHRLSLAQRRLLTQAELESRMLHLRRELGRQDERQGRLLAALSEAILRGQALARKIGGREGDAMRLHLVRMAHVVEDGQSTDPGLPPPEGHVRALPEIQRELLESWRPLAEALELTFEAPDAPQAKVWVGGTPIIEALHSLVDPLLLQMEPGTAIPMRWREEPGHCLLDLALPSGAGRVIPDAWSRGTLAAGGLDWRWVDGGLSLLFHAAPQQRETAQAIAMLGLVTEDLGLATLFQGAADAGSLGLFPLEEDPPAAPLPVFETVVVDAHGVKDPIACLRAYRAHPSFATTPILVVRAKELSGSDLLEAGATDWLTGALQWETLHHRLQALRGHRELQRRGRAAERLETVRQMAGTLKHEINNPLAVISLQNELLQRKYPDEPKLAKIAEQVQRIQGLMQVLQKMREPGEEDYSGGTSILKL